MGCCNGHLGQSSRQRGMAIQTGVGTEHSSNLQHKPRKKSWCPHPEPSSWTLCGSYLSSVSSGNHSRSDPVQVQSTSHQTCQVKQYANMCDCLGESHMQISHDTSVSFRLSASQLLHKVHPQCHSNICDCCSLR